MSGSGYIPNPTDPSQPTGSQFAKTAAAEFRALKQYIQTFSLQAPTWNPNDKSSLIELFNGDLLPIIQTPFTGDRGVRATAGKSGSGYYYIEHLVGQRIGTIQLGVSILNTSMDNGNAGILFGSDSNSIAYLSDGHIWHDGGALSGVPTYGFGDVIGIGISATDGVQFYKNGVFVSGIGWTPAIKPYTKFPVCALNTVNDYVLTNFGATPFTYPIPTGMAPFYDASTTAVTGPQNLIINTDMLFDVRNARAVQAAIVSNSYMSDRWRYETTMAGIFNAQSFVANGADKLATQGCAAYQRLSVAVPTVPGAADYSIITQDIEGINIARLLYGSANAKQVTVSFYYRCSVACKFTAVFQNNARNRSYLSLFEVTAGTVNTWQRHSFVVPGCQDGVWLNDTGRGISFEIGLGAGANFKGPVAGQWNNADDHQADTITNGFTEAVFGAAFDFTGIEIKPGYYSPAAPREVIAPAAQDLLCQRYYTKRRIYNAGYTNAAVTIAQLLTLPVAMRAVPAGTISANANTNCANSTFTALNERDISIRSAGVALGGFIQDCVADITAEL